MATACIKRTATREIMKQKSDLQLHIEFPRDDTCHGAPYSVVDGYVKGIGMLTSLVALAICRQGEDAGVNTVDDARRLFELMVSSPEHGSVILPLDIRELVKNTRATSSAIVAALFVVLSSIANGQGGGLKLLEHLSDVERATFAAEVAKLSSDESSRIVSLDFKEGSIRFSSTMALTATAKLKRFEVAPEEEIKSLIGEFVAVDTSCQEISVFSFETRKIVKCQYFPEAYDSRVMTPNNRIQVTGKFVEDDDGAIISMSDVNSIVGVDLSPLTVNFRGKDIVLEVELDADSGQYYWAVNRELGVEIFAETRAELAAEALDALASNWEQLVRLDDSRLDAQALSVKRALLSIA